MNESKEQIFDIYDIWYEPLLTQSWFMITLIIFLSIIVSLMLYFLYKQYKSKPVKIDPLVIIQQRLSYLDTIHIENEQDGKQFCFEITSLMKEYLAYRFHAIVSGMTDKEIMQWAVDIMPEDCFNILNELLLDILSIKFEHQIVTTQQLHEKIALMQFFIQKTTPEHTDRKGT